MALPLLLSVLPAVGLGFLVDSVFEGGMILVATTIAVVSMTRSWRHHRRLNALMVMSAGVVLLSINFYAHESHSPLFEDLHPWIAGVGGLLIATAHWINIGLCRSCPACSLPE